jgi:sugar lactone lactonase YvrE
MKRRISTLFACLYAVCGALSAQTTPATTTTVPAGVLYPILNAAHANGVRLQVAPDGSVWFLQTSADTLARFKDGVMRQWQIRATSQLGASPVDFQLDGQYVWLIESGESQIPAGTCAYARLDTVSGELTEYVIPGTIPSAFYRAPDGTVWLPQSASVLQQVNLQTLQVTNYRSLATVSYADMVVGPDGAFWLADFGDNRIVRYVPGATTETSWTLLDPSQGQLQPSQIQFDDQGFLWITERTADRVDRFDPTNNILYSYQNIIAPIHFDIFEGRVYITSINTTSQITVLDPNQATIDLATEVVPVTLSVGTTPATTPVTIRESNIPPVDVPSAPAPIDPSTFTVTNPSTSGLGGILTTTFPASNTYGIVVDGGHVWAGTDGNLAELNMQAIGDPSDVSVPAATSIAGATQIDLTISNRAVGSLPGSAFYLYSPASFTPRNAFTLAQSATSFIGDAFGPLASPATPLNGPVRMGIVGGTATNFLASVRSSRVLPNGGTFGYLFPAATERESLQQGSTTTLFTGANAGEVSILTFYSLDDAAATMTLFGPTGATRGTQSFNVAKNTSYSFNPASSAFEVAPEPGDVVQIGVTTGTLQASTLVFDAVSTDVLPDLPAPALTNSIVPWVGSFPNGDRSFSSDLYITNPSPDTPAVVTVEFAGVGAVGALPSSTLALAPLHTRALADVLLSLFGLASGQGALILSSNVPVVAAVRIATKTSAGDYGTFANAMDPTAGVVAGTGGLAIGLPQTATRTGLLVFYNAGAAGNATLSAFKADGTVAGTLTVPMGAQASAVVDAVFTHFGITDQPAGRVRVDVDAGMRVFGWSADVDQITGDIDLTALR